MNESDEFNGIANSDMASRPASQSALRRWLLLDGNRLVLAGLISVGIFVICAVLGWVGFIPVMEPGPLTTLVAGLVGGTLPFITIVLAINQLVLSQELGWVGTLRDRMAEMQEFRAEVEELANVSVSPLAPADFLRVLVERAETLVHTLTDHCDDADEQLRTDIAELENTVESRSDHVVGALKQAEFGTFNALSASLDYSTGEYLYLARNVQATHDALPAETEETLSEFTKTLASLDIARQYFKTLYTQHELAVLSRLLLYAGFPALFGGGLVILSYEEFLGLHPDKTVAVVVLSAVVVLIFSPFVVLFSYTLRIATLATYTADFGPFVPRRKL